MSSSVSWRPRSWDHCRPSRTPTAATRGLGFKSDNGVFVARSNDGGLTWSQPVAVASNLYDGQHPVNFEIKPDLAVDTFRTLPNGQPNPNYGNLYECWSRCYAPGLFPGEPTSTGSSDIMFAVSRDDGQSWEVQLQPPPGSSIPQTVIFDPSNNGTEPPAGYGFVNWSHVVVGANGDVYVSLFLEGTFSIYHSTDGGDSFVAPDFSGTSGLPLARSGDWSRGTRTICPSTSFVKSLSGPLPWIPASRIRCTRPRRSAPWARSGNAIDPGEINFARLVRSGADLANHRAARWPKASVLNDDNDGQIAQGLPDDVLAGTALPKMAVDAQGDIALIWYDTRRDPANHLLDVFATVSTDGGQTFSPNFRLTDVSFDPNAGQFIDATGQPDFYLGDSLGVGR